MFASLKAHSLKVHRQRTYSTFSQSSFIALINFCVYLSLFPSGMWVPEGRGSVLLFLAFPEQYKTYGNKDLTKKVFNESKNKLLSGQFWYMEIFLVSIYICAHFPKLLNLWLSILEGIWESSPDCSCNMYWFLFMFQTRHFLSVCVCVCLFIYCYFSFMTVH